METNDHSSAGRAVLPSRGSDAEVPPPPSGGQAYRDAHMAAHGGVELTPTDVLDAAIAVARPRPRGRSFDAELDIAEIDERGRAGPIWQATANSLSRSNLLICTRRMCYVGREIVIAVHLIDDQPIPLFGRVFSCEYQGDGMHQVDIDLLEVPDDADITAWAAERARS
ncbi:MAG: hypothetical protein AAF235_10450 [Planctomycetota bacterium]